MNPLTYSICSSYLDNNVLENGTYDAAGLESGNIEMSFLEEEIEGRNDTRYFDYKAKLASS